MQIEFSINPTKKEQQTACIKLTRELTNWFNHEESNVQYIKDAEIYDGIIIKDANDIIGLAIYREVTSDILGKKVLEVYWLGILEKYHGKGIGRHIFSKISQIAKSRGIDTLILKTLSPLSEDEAYLKTFKFYTSLGFKAFDTFSYSTTCHMAWLMKEV